MKRKWIGIILEDQQAHIDMLQDQLNKVEFVQIDAAFQEAAQAQTYLRVNPVDFIFLDVELGQYSGFDFLLSLPNSDLQVILYTAHEKYEDRGYDLRLVDVLLKPVSMSRLLGALRRLDDRLAGLLPPDMGNTLDSYYHYFHIKGPARYERRLIWMKHIVYIESQNGYLKIYCVGKKEPLICNATFKSVTEILPRRWFKQCHQSFVFNINFFDAYKSQKVYLVCEGTKLPTGDRSVYMDFYAFLDSNLTG